MKLHFSIAKILYIVQLQHVKQQASGDLVSYVVQMFCSSLNLNPGENNYGIWCIITKAYYTQMPEMDQPTANP